MAESSIVQIVPLANATLFDQDGRPVRMGTLWQTGTVLFVFLRHFACVACRAHAAEVWSQRAKYQVGNTRIIFIGNGQPQFIKTFKEDLQIQDAVIYTDPKLVSFKAAGFQRGFFRALGPKSLINGRKLIRAGHKQGQYEGAMGDLWQLGGLLVIKPDGRVAYHFISESTGDFPAEDEIKETPWIS